MRSTYDADDGDGNAFDDVYVRILSCRATDRNLRTYVHPTLLGTESWLEAVSRVFLKILKKLSFAERYPSGAHDLGWKPELLFGCRVYPRVGESESCTYVRTTLGWKPGLTFWNLNLNHVLHLAGSLDIRTYVRTFWNLNLNW